MLSPYLTILIQTINVKQKTYPQRQINLNQKTKLFLTNFIPQ